jgi:hypothetical protein
MALQPNSDPGLPLWGFVTITSLRGCIVSKAPNQDQASVFMAPGDRVAQLYAQALGTHFRRFYDMHGLQRDFFNPGYHMGQFNHYDPQNNSSTERF